MDIRNSCTGSTWLDHNDVANFVAQMADKATELESMVERLEGENADLRNEVEALKAEIEVLKAGVAA